MTDETMPEISKAVEAALNVFKTEFRKNLEASRADPLSPLYNSEASHKASIERLNKITTKALVLATKHCPASHDDWERILELALEFDAIKEEL